MLYRLSFSNIAVARWNQTMYILESLMLVGAALAAVQRLPTSATSAAPSSSTSNKPVTLMVWSTNPAGSAEQVAFSQKFTPMWTSLATPKAGSIGLGSIQGTVGTSREFAEPAVTTLALASS